MADTGTLSTKNKWLPSEYSGGGAAIKSRTYVPYEAKKQIAARKRTPFCANLGTEINDYFESASLTKVVDLICEGPIEGFSTENGETSTFFHKSRQENVDYLKSVYLDDTVVLSEKDGTFNFRVFDADFRRGEALQEPLPERYGYQGKTITYNTQLFPANNVSDGKDARDELIDLTELANPAEGSQAAQLSEKAAGGNTAASTALALNLDYVEGDTHLSGAISKKIKRAHSKEFRKQERHLHPVIHTITDPNVEVVSIGINVHALSKMKIGKRATETVPHEINFLIYVNNEGETNIENPPLLEVTQEMAEAHNKDLRAGGVVGPDVSIAGIPGLRANNSYSDSELIENDTGGFFIRRMKGLATSDYVFETVIHLPPNPRSSKRIVRVSMLDPDEEFSHKKGGPTRAAASLHSITEIVPCRLSYPNSAIISSMVDSRAFSNIPLRKYLLKLLKVKVPSNYLPETKEYVGNWNGKFKTLRSSAPELGVDPELVGGIGLTNYKSREAREVTQRSNLVKIKHVSRYGSGSLFFPASSGYGFAEEQEKSLRVRDTYQYVSRAASAGGRDKTDVSPLGTFADGNFTIEFYMKASEAQIKTVYDIKGGSTENNGVLGVAKTIIASEENAGMGHGSAVDVGHPGLSEMAFPADLWFYDQQENGAFSYSFLGQLLGGAWRIEIGTKGTTSDTNLGLGRLRFCAWHPSKGEEFGFHTRSLGQDKGLYTVIDAVEYGKVADIIGTTNVADDEWHHVALSRNGNTLTLFVDGAQEASGEVSEGIYGFKYISNDIPKYNIKENGAYPAGDLYTKGEVQIGGTRTPIDSLAGSQKYGTSYCGYLDEIMISHTAKYTAAQSFNAFPDHLTSLIQNDFSTDFYINGDNEANNSTDIGDQTKIVVNTSARANENIQHDLARLQWTDNPAWILYDLITNKRYGLGKYGIDAEFVDKWSLYEIAKYCDQKVKTNYAPKYTAKQFEVVDYHYGSEAAIDAGQGYIKIKGFSSQKEFEVQFPEFSTIALYDLNDDAEPVHRRITYLAASDVDNNKSQMTSQKYRTEDTRLEQLISYQGTTDKDSAGYAIVKIQRLISVDDAKIVEPSLVNWLQIQKSKRSNTTNIVARRASEKDNILNLINDPEQSHLRVTKYFNRNQPINKTSTSGLVAAEFNGNFDILEPRFSANLYITTQVDAYKLLNDIASIFRGITYFANGKIYAYFDKKRDAIFNFTNANVEGGEFIYSGSSKSDRYTACVVRYVDKYEHYKPKTEYIEDPDGIIKYGILEKELVAFGCASRSQAKRLGKWFLSTSQYETETVEFSAGKECGYLRPGDIIKVMDKTRTQKRFGGRVVDFVDGELKVKLDLNLSKEYIGEQIHITTIRDFEFSDSLDEKTDRIIIDEIGEGEPIYHPKVTDEEISNIRRSQISTYKIKNIEPDTSLVPVENRIVELQSLGGDFPSDFGKIKIGSIFILNQKGSDVKIQENLFKVVNVSQVDDLRYTVQALQYAESKFDLSDNKTNSKINFVHSKTPIEYSRPAKPIGVPRVSIKPLENGLERELRISWEEVVPTPEKYRIEIGMSNAVQAYQRTEAGVREEFSAPTNRWSMTVPAKSEGGTVYDTSVAMNIGSYTGEIDVAIYTVDANGNLDLIYY